MPVVLLPPRVETMHGLVEAIARERDANDGKARLVPLGVPGARCRARADDRGSSYAGLEQGELMSERPEDTPTPPTPSPPADESPFPLPPLDPQERGLDPPKRETHGD